MPIRRSLPEPRQPAQRRRSRCRAARAVEPPAQATAAPFERARGCDRAQHPGGRPRRAERQRSRRELLDRVAQTSQVAAVRTASRAKYGWRSSSSGPPSSARTGVPAKTTRWLSDERSPDPRYQARSTRSPPAVVSMYANAGTPSPSRATTSARSKPPAPEQNTFTPCRARPPSASTMRAGSPSPATGSAPHTPASSSPVQTASSSCAGRAALGSSSARRSAAFRWPSRMRAVDASTAATQRTSASCDASDRCASRRIAPASRSSPRFSPGNRGLRSSSGARAAIRSSACSSEGGASVVSSALTPARWRTLTAAAGADPAGAPRQ